MKSSGIEWIGDIPDEWKISKISRFFKITLGKMLETSPSSDGHTLENYLCSLNIKWDGVNCETIKKMWFSDIEKNNFLLHVGDILVIEGGDVGVSSEYRGEFYPCYFQNALNRLSSLNNNVCINKFLYYWMYFIKHSGYLELICNKATISHYTKEKLSNTAMAIPPISIQKKIVTILDSKISSINNLKNTEINIINILNEYRQSIITETVTKGLNKNAKMKDSGIEWIGDIPDNWSCIDFRRTVRLKQGLQIAQNNRYYCYYPGAQVYITLKYLHSNMGEEDREYIKTTDTGVMCSEDDILFVRTGETGVIVTNISGVYHNNFFKIIYDKNMVRKDYLIYYLKNQRIQKYFRLMAGTTTIPDLNHDDFLSSKILIPSLTEQEEISRYLDRVCQSIDAIISKKEAIINKLEEYKKSLIYEYVTGKRSVET